MLRQSQFLLPVSFGMMPEAPADRRFGGERMDEKDKLLLTLLRRDARRSIVALARDLNLSRSATQERLQKLQASGAIGAFTIVKGRPPPLARPLT